MNEKCDHYIDGHWRQGHGCTMFSVNPADNSIIWQGRCATSDEIKAAYEAARRASYEWGMLDFNIRANYLTAFAKKVSDCRDELARIISIDSGKPLWESRTEVTAVINKIQISIAAHIQRLAETNVTISAGITNNLRYKAHGVVAVLGPFNFPAHISNGHIVPALLAGNTIIYKPSELTPMVAAFIMQCWHDSGLPAGVINCVQGGVDVAKTLLAQAIDGVYFTGSYQTGIHINKQFSVKPEVILALEMGGNNPLIIDTDVDIKAAVYNTILSAFLTSGQRCTCARRIIVADDAVGSLFLEQFMRASQQLKIGNYLEQPEPFMGPTISYDNALAHLRVQQKLKDSGGEIIMEMVLMHENTGFLSPGIIDMSAVTCPADEEVFAPLVQIFRYSNFDEAINIANNTRYGLAAGLFSNNAEHYKYFYKTMRAGLINWNRPTTGATSDLPFGGVGRSGNHRPSAYFAADYCAYPVASLEQEELTLPVTLLPGI